MIPHSHALCVQAGRFDLAVGGITNTLQRQKLVAFARTLEEGGKMVCIPIPVHLLMPRSLVKDC